MTEACEDCECGLSEDNYAGQTVKIPGDEEFNASVREFVVENARLDGEDVFIDRVIICPSETKVEYSTR
jgi:hypothetical protein